MNRPTKNIDCILSNLETEAETLLQELRKVHEKTEILIEEMGQYLRQIRDQQNG
jgi:hypothetical protein